MKLRKLLGLAIFLGIAFLLVGAAKPFSESFLQNVEKKYGDYAKRRLIAWHKLSTEYKNADERTKLEEVNRFFNLFEFQTDQAHWGKEDYWATPLEFVVTGMGDCEDYTIAKYFTLLTLGVSDDKLLITYVKALEQNEAHMVLTYYATPDSIPLVLDNLNKEILPANERKDLVPIYSFNGKGLWKAKHAGLGGKLGESSDLKRWTDLEERMKQEQNDASR